jgi:hypothetical protein
MISSILKNQDGHHLQVNSAGARNSVIVSPIVVESSPGMPSAQHSSTQSVHRRQPRTMRIRISGRLPIPI